MNFVKDCGLMVEPQEGMDVGELLAVAAFVEEIGFGYLFRSDHLLPTSRRKGLDSPECWTTLGAIAAKTSTLKFGPMVSPIGFRNPALLARMACTVDALAGGRLQLGVGAGWYGDEYLAHGFEFPDLRTRKRQFRESLRILRPLTQVGRVDFEGEYFAAHLDGLSETKRRIHMIIGGRAPFIVRQTAAFGDEWNFFAPIPENFDVLKAGLEASGREIGISQMGPFIVAENASQLRARVGREMRRRGIAGDEEVQVEALRKRGWLVGITDDFRETVNRLRERGVEKFYFQALETSDRDHVELLASILKEM